MTLRPPHPAFWAFGITVVFHQSLTILWGAQKLPDSGLQAAVGKIPVLPRNAHRNILDGHHTLAQSLCTAAAFQGQEKK